MPNVSGPYLVRDEQAIAEPGVHSFNRTRRTSDPLQARQSSRLRLLRIIFFVLGLAALGYYGYTLVDESVYQAYENWSFDQQIAGRAKRLNLLDRKSQVGCLRLRANPDD